MRKTLNVGMVGTGAMAKAHSQAYATMPMCFPDAPVLKLKAIADVTPELAKKGAERFGFEEWVVGWEELVSRPDIDVVSILTPNDSHKEIAVAAAKAGKHILCEKPMAMNVAEAKEMYEAVKKAGVVNMLGYQYRRTPAVVETKRMLEAGEIGDPLFFRGFYLQDWAIDPRQPLVWRLQSKIAGLGTLGDIGSHIIDYALYLLGDITKVSAMMKTWIHERPVENGKGLGKVDVDDEVAFLMEFASGALGCIQSSRFAAGRKNFIAYELDCSRGSVTFDFERMNELNVYSRNDPENRQGYKCILTGPLHAYGEGWYAIPGMVVGYTDAKIAEARDFAEAVVKGVEVRPNFLDGLRNHLVIEAILESTKTRSWADVAPILPR